LFVGPSVFLVSIWKHVGLQANLIVGDGLLQIFEKPGHIFIILNVVDKLPQLWLPVQRPQLSLDVLELAVGKSTPSIGR